MKSFNLSAWALEHRAVVLFLILAVTIAGALGFGGLAAAAGGIAQILFYIFLVMFLVALIAGLVGRSRPPAI